jgi:glyoxylase-like metal-dependent hydrolase (beta-lactamase superfamily II)
MPPTQTNPVVLHWEVFVTPGIPIVTRDKPPDVRETNFQAMAATLIYGVRDAVLVDAFMTVKQANALADWVAARGRNLTTIYITHGHGDHWFVRSPRRGNGARTAIPFTFRRRGRSGRRAWPSPCP